jgi:RNA polymerase sigma-32 factor
VPELPEVETVRLGLSQHVIGASIRAIEVLDERSRRIVEERWLKVNDNGSGGMTLHDLADEYGVSAERIRQIEVAAMKKMKKALVEFA